MEEKNQTGCKGYETARNGRNWREQGSFCTSPSDTALQRYKNPRTLTLCGRHLGQ